jgi:hypothetical protein
LFDDGYAVDDNVDDAKAENGDDHIVDDVDVADADVDDVDDDDAVVNDDDDVADDVAGDADGVDDVVVEHVDDDVVDDVDEDVADNGDGMQSERCRFSFSGLGTMPGAAGHVFMSWLHPILSTSDEHRCICTGCLFEGDDDVEYDDALDAVDVDANDVDAGDDIDDVDDDVFDDDFDDVVADDVDDMAAGN